MVSTGKEEAAAGSIQAGGDDRVYLVSAPVDLSPAIDLRFWVGQCWQAKWIFLILVFVGGAAGFATSYLFSPVYRAEVVLSPITDDGNRALMGLSSQLASVGLGGLGVGPSDSKREEAIAVLRSRVLVEQLIRERDMLPQLFASDWDAEKGAWRVADDEIPTLEDAYLLFDSDIRNVEVDAGTGLVSLTIDWRDREEAEAWARDLVGLADTRLRNAAIEEARSSIDFLEAELEGTSRLAIQQVITRLIETQLNNITLANARGEYAFRTIDPPKVPDVDHYVWPARGFLARVGAALGLILGACLVLLRSRGGHNSF